jgi:hypothetical protein
LLCKDRVIYQPKNWRPYFKFLFSSSRLFYKGTFAFCSQGFNLGVRVTNSFTKRR